jgi:SAM-dependent methyltransferase
VRPGRLLDVGCWTGSLLAAAVARGWEASGVEPSAWAVARAQERGLAVTQGSLDELPADTFRLVTSCDVLEHLLDPGDGLDRIARVLEPGGWLYLTVPDAGSPVACALGRRWWSVLPMHVQHFTRGSARRLLEAHGFAVVDVRSHAKTFTAGYYAGRLAAFVPWLGRPLAATLGRTGRADRLVSPGFGDRMQVLARRLPL